jgi:hypothetical protein
MAEWFSNLPKVSMTRHILIEGAVEVYDDGRVIWENWTDHPSYMNLYREDAEVLRYLADALEADGDDAPVDGADDRIPAPPVRAHPEDQQKPAQTELIDSFKEFLSK